MNITSRKVSCNAFGFTLIELMVSLLIAMIVLGGVFQIFVKSSDGNRRLEGLAGVLDNGRFAMSFMQSVIQGAGYRGCRAGVTLNNNLNYRSTSLPYDPLYRYDFVRDDGTLNYIIGYDADADGGKWTPGLDASITKPVVPPTASVRSDIITVRGITGPSDVVTAPMATLGDPITLSGNNSFGPGSILLISDCNGNADIFQKTNAGAATAAHVTGPAKQLPPKPPNNAPNKPPNNAPRELSFAYGTTASVVVFGTTTFYLRKPNPPRVPVVPSSLYVIQGANVPQELVEGVDGMQILYGVTTNGDTSANQYLTAAQVDAGGAGPPPGLWASVVSVRIALLLRTVREVTRTPDLTVYNLLGAKYGPFNDLRLRRIFTTTIALRNRSL